MRWVKGGANDFSGVGPSPRSGHTAVSVGGGKLVVFGGLVDKKFLNDVIVLDTDNTAWYRPECTGGGGGGVGAGGDHEEGPCPRAFHVAVALDRNMFVFGGRAGKRRLGDFWMLDTDTWQWAELTGFGQVPGARDFATAAAIGPSRIVLYGGWDSTKWLSDVYVLDTLSLEWQQLAFSGPTPPPRCGHTAIVVERRLLIFGGRGGGGPIMADLWALKGLFPEDGEAPAWTLLKLPGAPPSARCGHSCASLGTQVVVFGGHGTGGWITRYDVYYDDTVTLDRTSVQWGKMALPSAGGETPAARAYHSMTRVGKRLLLLGGYDGKATFDDTWWLVPDDRAAEPAAAAARAATTGGDVPLQPTTTGGAKHGGAAAGGDATPLSAEQAHVPSEAQRLAVLRTSLGLPATPPPPALPSAGACDAHDDPDLVSLGRRLLAQESGLEHAEKASTAAASPDAAVQAARTYLMKSDAKQLRMAELGPLLCDYRRGVSLLRLHSGLGGDRSLQAEERPQELRYYHIHSPQELRMEDIEGLQREYTQVLRSGAQSVQ